MQQSSESRRSSRIPSRRSKLFLTSCTPLIARHYGKYYSIAYPFLHRRRHRHGNRQQLAQVTQEDLLNDCTSRSAVLARRALMERATSDGERFIMSCTRSNELIIGVASDKGPEVPQAVWESYACMSLAHVFEFMHFSSHGGIYHPAN